MADNPNISPDMIDNLVNMLKSNLNDSSSSQSNENAHNSAETSSSNTIDFDTIIKMKSILETLNNKYNHNFSNTNYHKTKKEFPNNLESKEKASADSIEVTEAFFEILGLKLYFDDILIICILFFLYTENVQNEGLFICLIMLLLT